MDYSKFYPSIIMHYISILVAIIIAFGLLIYAVIYCFKQFMKQNAVEKDSKFLWFIRTKDGFIDFLGTFIFLFLALFILYLSRYIIADVPNVLSNNYVVTRGVVIGPDSSGKDDVPETRSFTLKEFDTGNKITFLVTYTPIRQGDVYEVIYLPYSKVGAIVRKIEDFNEE